MCPATPLAASLVRAGFEALPTQLAIIDDAGEILYTNRAWRQFAAANGMDGDVDCIGDNYLGVCTASDDEDAATAIDGIEAVLAGERESFSMEYPCHSPAERRWFTMRAVGFSHGRERYLLVMHLDITERKLAEERVGAHNERLETLAGVLSHDIRNPLGVAAGRATMLAEEVESVHIDPIQLALDRTQTIIDDALLLARNATVEDPEPVDLETAARQAWDHVETAPASLVVADSRTVEGDPDLLGHVFENLFRNAIEHAGNGCTVRVGTLDAGFYVDDDGPGIPPGEREDVFQTGYSTAETGTGFGLAIVSRVVDAHGWTVHVEESPAGGARFAVRTAKGR